MAHWVRALAGQTWQTEFSPRAHVRMEEAEPLPKLPSHHHIHSLSYHSPDKGFSQSNVYSSVMALSYFRINERPFTSLEKKLMHEKYKVNILEKTNILKKRGASICHTNGANLMGLFMARGGKNEGKGNY